MKIACQIGVWDVDWENNSVKGAVEEAIKGMGKEGIQGIELFVEHITPYYGEIDLFKEILRKANIKLSGVYFNSQDFLEEEKTEDILKKAEDAFELLKAVNCKYLVLNGGISKEEGQEFSEANFKQFAKIANLIGKLSLKHNVRTVMHPHLKCMIERLSDVDRLLKAGLNKELVGLCVHASHQLIVGADPYEIYEKHASWVEYAHIGDNNFLGQGELDQDRLMKALLDAGYDGYLVIESRLEKVSSVEYANKAIKYMKLNWPQVNWERL